MIRRNWTHDELFVVFNLYCCLPFGQFTTNNPKVEAIAKLIGRTSGAVAMKLCNFASFDPIHKKRGVKGLGNASIADKKIWEEFNADWDNSVTNSNELLEKMRAEHHQQHDNFEEPKGPTDIEAVIRQRRGQNFFRQAILSAYENKCCISGISLPELLIASHILPWSDFPKERLNPRNGLCLSAIHDAAFDKGLIAVDENYCLLLSKKLRKISDNIKSLKDTFLEFEGKDIILPGRFLPNQEFLEFHRDNIFKY